MGKKTIVCFGDSNTHGYNGDTGGRFDETERWPCLLENLLGEEYLIREEGCSGRTTCFVDPLWEGLAGIQLIAPILMTHEPVDLLVIMLGTNDVKTRFSATPENIAVGMTQLVHKAKNVRDVFRNNEPHILIIAPPPIEKGYLESSIGGEMGERCIEKSKALAPLYQAVAEQMGCGFMDAGQIEGIGMNHTDYMHLTKESHRLLAEAVAEKIKEMEK